MGAAEASPAPRRRGSIRPHYGGFHARVTAGGRPGAGQRIVLYEVAPTRREAERALTPLFDAAWVAAASLSLGDGDPTVAAEYGRHGRIARRRPVVREGPAPPGPPAARRSAHAPVHKYRGGQKRSETRAPRGSGVFGGGAYRAVAAPSRVRGSGRSGHQPALIAGVGGTGVSARTIVLTGLAGLVAGAFSLGTGECVSVTNQNELVHAEVAVERRMHALFPEAEQAQLQDTFRRYGADEDTATRMAPAVSRPRDRAPGAHPRGRCAMSSRRSRPAPPRVPRDRGRYGGVRPGPNSGRRRALSGHHAWVLGRVSWSHRWAHVGHCRCTTRAVLPRRYCQWRAQVRLCRHSAQVAPWSQLGHASQARRVISAKGSSSIGTTASLVHDSCSQQPLIYIQLLRVEV